MIKKLFFSLLFILIFSLVSSETTFFEDPNDYHFYMNGKESPLPEEKISSEILAGGIGGCLESINCSEWTTCELGHQKRFCLESQLDCKKFSYTEEKKCSGKILEEETPSENNILKKILVILILGLIAGVSFLVWRIRKK